MHDLPDPVPEHLLHPPEERRLNRLVFQWCSLGIVLLVALCLLQVYETSGAGGLRELGSLALVSLLLVGKFVIFSGLHGDAPSPWVLGLMVWLIDLVLALVLLSGLERFEEAPVLGRWLRSMRRKAVKAVEKYPGLRRMAFAGVLMYVMMPLAATGAITGALASRLVGLGRTRSLIAIGTGSALTVVAFCLLARFVGERAADLVRSPVLVGSLLAVLIVLGRKAYRLFLAEMRRG